MKSPHWAASLDGQAYRYSISEAWAWVVTPPHDAIRGAAPGRWERGDLMGVLYSGSTLTEAQFAELFPEVMPLRLPDEAFAAATPPILQHHDRVGPLPDDSWDSDPTCFMRPLK
jgi:hypothetical protein